MTITIEMIREIKRFVFEQELGEIKQNEKLDAGEKAKESQDLTESYLQGCCESWRAQEQKRLKQLT